MNHVENFIEEKEKTGLDKESLFSVLEVIKTLTNDSHNPLGELNTSIN
jgi:hypothetical protein